jgi:hypothetical protein
MNTFISVGSMKTWYQFWAIMNELKLESLSSGMFFLMRDPCPPLWESHHHIRGGCYSFKSLKSDTPDICIKYILAMMLSQLTSHPDNIINGISVSHKREFNVIKIWNSDALKFNQPSDINTDITTIHTSDIIYTPFHEKKMW